MSSNEGASIDLRFSDEELEAARDLATSFIQDQVQAAGADRAVIGLSGGIDSTLTAYLATDALGAEALHGLILPSSVNPDADETDAERIATELEIEFDVIEIEPIVEKFLSAYTEGETNRVSVGNVRVRSRAVLAYLVANTENGIVLGTGNRTEALVGYFTKYGDGAVDCHPIGFLYKQQVRQLARHIGVPDDIVDRTPTAGMWVGQTDEEELGMSYDTLDAILALSIDGPCTPTVTARILGIDISLIERVQQMYEQSAHKRAVPPAPHPNWL